MVLLIAACTATPAPAARPGLSPWPSASASAGTPRPDHVLIVVFENKALGQLDGSRDAPYLNALMGHSAVYTQAYAETHPSQPNYVALFSGDPQGVTSDACPVRLPTTANLGRQLLDTGFTFAGYSEAMPHAGYTGCSSGRYAAKHNPWVDFGNLPSTVNLPASALPNDYAALPTVGFLIPDLCNDMHDCPVASGDAWSQNRLDGYARWAQRHNSALIVTFDEDNHSENNRILTFVCGAHTTPGRYDQRINHYNVLATIEDWYGLPRLGHAAGAEPLTRAWSS